MRRGLFFNYLNIRLLYWQIRVMKEDEEKGEVSIFHTIVCYRWVDANLSVALNRRSVLPCVWANHVANDECCLVAHVTMDGSRPV